MTASLTVLLLLALVMQEAVGRLGWTFYTLARDLPCAGVALGAGALAWSVLGRRWPALARSGPWLSRTGHAGRRWPWGLGIGLAAGLALMPSVLPLAPPGLTWRVERAGLASPEVRVPAPSVGVDAPAPWGGEHLTATIGGWLYAPLAGAYEFSVIANARAVLRINGAVVAGTGPAASPDGGIRLTRGWHRLDLRYGQDTGAARLEVRWMPPHAGRRRQVPAVFLLPDGSPVEVRRATALAFALQRAGILGLAVLAAIAGGVAMAGARVGAGLFAPGRLAGRLEWTTVLLLCFLLTGTALLFPPERVALLRPALLALLVLGAVALLPRSGPTGAPATRSRRGPLSWPTGWALLLLLLLLVQVALAIRFVGALKGQLPFSDDHGAFLYRYHMLAHTFPRLISYDPWWNAGTLDSSAVGGGAASVFLLTWPLVHVLSLPVAYAWFVPVVAILVAPWSLFAATRLLGGPPLAALVAGLLALAPEEHLFVWLFYRGTLPAILAAALAPLAFVLAWRVFAAGDRRWPMLLGLAVVLNLGSFWMLFPLMVLPGLLAGVVARRRVGWREAGLAAGLGGALLLVNAGWLVGFLRARALSHLVEPQAPPALAWSGAWQRLTEVIPMTESPVGLVLGCAGLMFLPRGLRLAYGVTLGTMALASTVGPDLFPPLELLRFVIPLGFALIPPAALLVARTLRLAAPLAPRAPRPGTGVGALLAVALLLVLGAHLGEAWSRYGLNTRRTVGVMPDRTRAVVDWLRTHASPEARILFAGRVVHQYGGHVAYLQPLTGRPMFAGSYYHGDWGGGRIGPALLADPAALRHRLELLNVRHVVADETDRRWWEGLRAIPWLRPRAEFPGIAIYETDVAPAYLLGARGAVTFDYNRIAVRLAEPADAVVLKFRWVDGLSTRPPLPLQPLEAWPGTHLIRVHPGRTLDFEIRY